MRKESIIVGIFGLSLGLLVAWAIWNFKSAAPQVEELAISPAPTTAVSPAPTSPLVVLTLANPPEDFVATESSILLSGKAKPDSIIVIATNLDDYILTAGQDGNFSQEIGLEEGENLLTVTAYGPDQEEEAVERSVIYTKEQL